MERQKTFLQDWKRKDEQGKPKRYKMTNVF